MTSVTIGVDSSSLLIHTRLSLSEYSGFIFISKEMEKGLESRNSAEPIPMLSTCSRRASSRLIYCNPAT